MTELAPASTPDAALIDRALDAALELAADRPWGEISLRDIARAAEVGFAELYARAPGKRALLERLSQRLDAAALDTPDDPAAQPHDRLFEAVMARVEAMEPHRAVLIAVGRSEGPWALAPLFPRTARVLLESAGVDTEGLRGAARVATITGVWGRILQVWRDDEGALNRTMAEIDRRLKRADEALRRVGAGWSRRD